MAALLRRPATPDRRSRRRSTCPSPPSARRAWRSDGDVDRPARRRPGRCLDLLGLRQGQAATKQPELTLQPSDVRGQVKAGAAPVTGTVELVTSGPDFETITSKVKAKYGLMVPISRLMDRLRHLGKGPFPYADTGVMITLQA